MDLSIVIPVNNEAENLRSLFDEIEQVMKTTSVGWELIFVDDGSKDSGYDIIREIADRKSVVRCVCLGRNYGKTSALDAGFRHAQGDFVLMMDGDCQDDPNDIPKFLEATRDHDAVCGIRMDRRDSQFRVFQSRVANAVRNFVTRDGVLDSGCGFQAHRRSMLNRIPLYDGMHRFLPCLMQLEGASFTQIEVHHRPRYAGRSKVPFWIRFWRSCVDLLAVRWIISRRLRYSVRD